MNRYTRRSMLKGAAAALPAAGIFALPSLARGIQENSTPQQRPKVKITDIRTAQVLVHGPQTHVRVYTDSGLYGQGESTDAAVGTASLVHGFRRMLIGQDPLNVDALWERMRVSGIFAGAQGGQYVTAMTGVEIALWDLAGKILGLPVYQLLGGKFRDKVRMYCDSDMENPIGEESDRKLPWIKEQGFTAMKIDLDDAADPARFDKVNWTASNGEIDRMVSWVKHVRESIPKEMDLACDMHGRYDATTGKRVAVALEPYRLLWLEEPVPPEDIDAMADIRHSTTTPICCGENLYHALGLHRTAAEARGRHHHAGHSKGRRTLRGAQDRQHGPGLLRSLCSPLRRLSHRHHGLGPRVRDHSQLPGLRVALDQPSQGLADIYQRGRDYSKRLRHPSG